MRYNERGRKVPEALFINFIGFCLLSKSLEALGGYAKLVGESGCGCSERHQCHEVCVENNA